jgi:predicted nucleic acid-binding Zn ribbon protein
MPARGDGMTESRRSIHIEPDLAPVLRTCIICGKELHGKQHKTCSPEHHDILARIRSRESSYRCSLPRYCKSCRAVLYEKWVQYCNACRPVRVYYHSNSKQVYREKYAKKSIERLDQLEAERDITIDRT